LKKNLFTRFRERSGCPSCGLFLTGFIVFLLLSVFFQVKAEKHFTFRNTKLFSNEFAEVAGYRDFWLIFFGHRRIAADIVFMEMLQYYGTIHYDELIPGAKKTWGEGFGTGIVTYSNLFKYALHCIRLDRNFEFAATFSAAALAWVQEREEEGISILEDALKFRPDFFQAGLYLSAITVRKNKGLSESVKYLELAATYPDCPDMVKNILAGIYEKTGDYKNALRIYAMNVNSRDLYYRKNARSKIRKYLPSLK